MSRPEKVLIVFVRNLLSGKVKTRISRKTSDAFALSVYQLLLDRTKGLVATISKKIEIKIYYSEFIDPDDHWQNIADKRIQSGKNLGEKMYNAFAYEFGEGAGQVCIIGSDIIDLKSNIIDKAFYLLSKNEVVLGPAKDGGYYLLGMNTLHKMLFENKSWSTDKVFKETVIDLNQEDLSFGTLEELIDIDKPEDIPPQITEILKEQDKNDNI